MGRSNGSMAKDPTSIGRDGVGNPPRSHHPSSWRRCRCSRAGPVPWGSSDREASRVSGRRIRRIPKPVSRAAASAPMAAHARLRSMKADCWSPSCGCATTTAPNCDGTATTRQGWSSSSSTVRTDMSERCLATAASAGPSVRRAAPRSFGDATTCFASRRMKAKRRPFADSATPSSDRRIKCLKGFSSDAIRRAFVTNESSCSIALAPTTQCAPTTTIKTSKAATAAPINST